MTDKVPAGPEKPIGMATMRPDGTVVLDLRAEGTHGETGVAQAVYPPSHPQYESVLQHVGGLRPGEQKLVLPWPD
jgi:hypothetical protein